MDAPPDKEDMRPFIEIAQRLHQLGLNVPEVLEQDLARGYCCSRLGQQMYCRNSTNPRSSACTATPWARWSSCRPAFSRPGFLPEYDEALLRRELELFRECILAGTWACS